VFLPFVSRLLTHLHIQKTKKTNEQTLLLYDPSIMKWVWIFAIIKILWKKEGPHNQKNNPLLLYDSFGMKWVWIFQIIKSFGYGKKDQSHVANTKKQKGKSEHLAYYHRFVLVSFVRQKISTIFQKMQASSILSRAIVECLIISWVSPFTCHSFPAGWSSYSCKCNNTCWDQHFLVLDGIMKCSSLITPSYLFSSLTLWKSSGLILSPVASFFNKSLTRVGVCFASNRHSFKYCASMSLSVHVWVQGQAFSY